MTEPKPRKRAPRPGEGRPSKYEPRFCDELIECAAKGYSLAGFAGKIGVARSTISEWADAYPEFSNAVARARSSAAYSWETRAIRVGDEGGGPGASQMIQFALRSLAGDDWHDKQLVEHSGGIDVRAEAADEARRKLGALTAAGAASKLDR